MTFGLYVHVPFCSTLCPYCDFAVVVGKTDLHERYCDALVDEARATAWDATATTVFVGGGTPTLLDAELLARTLERLRAIVPVAADAEVTIEANPESVDEGSLRTLRAAGVTRVSIGAQSFDDDVLRALGRTHAAADVDASVGAARAAGFDTVSLDLIYGGPGESDASWEASVARAIALGVEHVSCYALTIEERTAFGRAVARGRMDAPDDDRLAERYGRALSLLDAAGYEHYEISNWALPGHACRHNLTYWTQGDYLGLGVGAHSHRGGVRWWNTRALGRYLADPTAAREGEERLDPIARAEEWVALRLRLLAGIDVGEVAAWLGRPVPVDDLVGAGLARVTGERLALTARGMLLENEVAARVLAS